MIPVILSGGSGTRLWPISTANLPKQFCALFEKSLFDQTVLRLRPFGSPLVLTVENLEKLTVQAALKLGLSTDGYIYEPRARNTAPAMAYLCHRLLQSGKKQDVIGVFPADHLIVKEARFHEVLKVAESLAQKGEVVTLGLRPTFPATGYGYIEVEEAAVGADFQKPQGFRVLKFREKPKLADAEAFMAQKRFFWNSGMFVFRLDVMVEKFKQLTPDLWREISSIRADSSNAAEVYDRVQAISFDYAVMEHLTPQTCIPCDIGWSDVGSWDQLASCLEESPELRTSSRAQVIEVESAGNFVLTHEARTVALVGCENLVVVDTPEALLVTPKAKSQKVKEVPEKLAALPESERLPARVDHRPWGHYEVLVDDEKFKVKTIVVEAGQRLSYQSHTKRAEHWIVVSGEAEVTLDDKPVFLKIGEHVFIPQGAKHRIRNPGEQPLIFVEVQTGAYFGEDDITRYSDDYNRR